MCTHPPCIGCSRHTCNTLVSGCISSPCTVCASSPLPWSIPFPGCLPVGALANLISCFHIWPGSSFITWIQRSNVDEMHWRRTPVLCRVWTMNHFIAQSAHLFLSSPGYREATPWRRTLKHMVETFVLVLFDHDTSLSWMWGLQRRCRVLKGKPNQWVN